MTVKKTELIYIEIDYFKYSTKITCVCFRDAELMREKQRKKEEQEGAQKQVVN